MRRAATQTDTLLRQGPHYAERRVGNNGEYWV